MSTSLTPVPSKTFLVMGETYLEQTPDNRVIEYEVVSLDRSNLTIRYEHGVTKTLPAAAAPIRLRMHQNAAITIKKNNLDIRKGFETNDYTVLGWLAKNACLTVKVLEDRQRKFALDYKDATGVDINETGDAYFQTAQLGTRFGLDSYVKFSEDCPVADEFSYPVNHCREQKTKYICKASWFWTLLRRGFRLGHAHDVAAIRESVPAQYRVHFDQGFSL